METVGHISVNGIIYRKADPSYIFTDIKDKTYPHIVWRGCACLIGGNWTGQGAMNDLNPIATFRREIKEELSFAKQIQSTTELGETSLHTTPITYRVKGNQRLPETMDYIDLLFVQRAIEQNARVFDDYILTIPREVFLRGDPETKQQDIIALCCVLESGLDEETWIILERLQRDFGNLSCESESNILSIDDMIQKNILAMSGQDQILQEFFEVNEAMYARTLPRDPAVIVRRAPVHPRSDYDKYLKHYTVLRKPEGW